MPVTKTAKRALRVSKRKTDINKKIMSDLEIAIRSAQKSPTKTNISKVNSLADRASKKGVIHKNKAARIKSSANKLGDKPSKSK